MLFFYLYTLPFFFTFAMDRTWHGPPSLLPSFSRTPLIIVTTMSNEVFVIQLEKVGGCFANRPSPTLSAIFGETGTTRIGRKEGKQSRKTWKIFNPRYNYSGKRANVLFLYNIFLFDRHKILAIDNKINIKWVTCASDPQDAIPSPKDQPMTTEGALKNYKYGSGRH